VVKFPLNLRARNVMRVDDYLWVIELKASFFVKCARD